MAERATEMTSRREFARALAALAVAGPLTVGCRGVDPPATRAVPPPTPTPVPAEAVRLAEDLEPDALLAIVQHRYGEWLTEAQLAAIRRAIVSGLRSAERLRHALLQNGDGPVAAFSACRRGE